mgnify:CR=1 FL=1
MEYLEFSTLGLTKQQLMNHVLAKIAASSRELTTEQYEIIFNDWLTFLSSAISAID